MVYLHSSCKILKTSWEKKLQYTPWLSLKEYFYVRPFLPLCDMQLPACTGSTLHVWSLKGSFPQLLLCRYHSVKLAMHSARTTKRSSHASYTTSISSNSFWYPLIVVSDLYDYSLERLHYIDGLQAHGRSHSQVDHLISHKYNIYIYTDKADVQRFQYSRF